MLLTEATTADPGFDVTVLVQMTGSLDRFDDNEFPLPLAEVPDVRALFRQWADDLRADRPECDDYAMEVWRLIPAMPR